MTPLQWAKVAGAGVAALLIFLAVLWVKERADELDRLRESHDAMIASEGVAQAASASLQDQAVGQARQETQVTGRRAALDRRYQEITRENPSVASWAATAVPAELRDADREADRGPGDHPPGGAAADAAPAGDWINPAPG